MFGIIFHFDVFFFDSSRVKLITFSAHFVCAFVSSESDGFIRTDISESSQTIYMNLHAMLFFFRTYAQNHHQNGHVFEGYYIEWAELAITLSPG